ncbi:MAG: hypothetical protein CMB20_001280 [Methanobacteriota archaeon]|nr:MAG: hypothetical protein CMB20_001280 [Euryarchaeota archaeon]|tara:strand:- start:170 stop:799 length:630 start_codon:yes stop_codon:yes gene_type:complete
MAKTIINLSDPVSTLVTKSNTISSHLGDITQLNVGASNDSDIVQAINFVNGIVQKTDSADIINLIDSSYVQARQTGVTRSSVLGFFIKDSANGIGLDSSQGRFFIPSNTINTAMIEATSITTAKLATNAVTTAKITDGNVTGPKLGTNAVGTVKIVDGNVTTAKIANDAVTEDKIGDDAVSSVQLKTLSTLLIKDVNGSTLKTIHGAGA